MNTHKFATGTKFIPISNRKNQQVITITKQLRVLDENDEIVEAYYEGEHEGPFGQIIKDRRIVEVTIARGLAEFGEQE